MKIKNESGLYSYFYERQSAWKIFLPALPEVPILAVGLTGIDLISLARSWQTIHTYNIAKSVVEWATGQANLFNLCTQFKNIGTEENINRGYFSIAIGGECIEVYDPFTVWRWLKPGGSIIWINHRTRVPSSSSLRMQGFVEVRRYAVLPANSCKVIMPIGNHQQTRTGLNFYVPVKWLNRQACRFLCLLSKLGLNRILSTKHLVVAKKLYYLQKGSYLFEWLSSQLGTQVSATTIYPGTNEAPDQRKITLQLLNDEGHAIAIAKIADTNLSKKALDRETVILNILQKIDTLRESTPKIIATETWQNYLIQIQECFDLRRIKHRTKIMQPHLNFLSELSKIDCKEMRIQDWPKWNQILRWTQEGQFESEEVAKTVRQAVLSCADIFGYSKLTFHRNHGDFTPWNVFVKKQKLIAVDWEDSDPTGLPFQDLVHFALRRHTLLEMKELDVIQLFNERQYYLRIESLLPYLYHSVKNLNDYNTLKQQDIIKGYLILNLSLELMHECGFQSE
jgi:hypothetical protein